MLVQLFDSLLRADAAADRQIQRQAELDLEAQAPSDPSDPHNAYTPLALVALLVISLNVLETALTLVRFGVIGWMDAVVAGSILKLLVLVACLNCAEDLLRCKQVCSSRYTLSVASLRLWVHSHRMARDVLTSTVILIALVPFVVLNTINECVNPDCNLHQLFFSRSQAFEAPGLAAAGSDPASLVRQNQLEPQ